MTEPTAETIQRLKDTHKDCALHLVEMKPEGSEEKFYFVMKGANSDEYDKANADWAKARDAKEADRSEQFKTATKNAALRQTVWPDREELKDILYKNPGLLLHFPDEIHKQAGTTAEVRSKKL